MFDFHPQSWFNSKRQLDLGGEEVQARCWNLAACFQLAAQLFFEATIFSIGFSRYTFWDFCNRLKPGNHWTRIKTSTHARCFSAAHGLNGESRALGYIGVLREGCTLANNPLEKVGWPAGNRGLGRGEGGWVGARCMFSRLLKSSPMLRLPATTGWPMAVM